MLENGDLIFVREDTEMGQAKNTVLHEGGNQKCETVFFLL